MADFNMTGAGSYLQEAWLVGQSGMRGVIFGVKARRRRSEEEKNCETASGWDLIGNWTGEGFALVAIVGGWRNSFLGWEGVNV